MAVRQIPAQRHSPEGSSEHIYEVPYEDPSQWANGSTGGNGGGPGGGVNILPLPPKTQMMTTRNEQVNPGQERFRDDPAPQGYAYTSMSYPPPHHHQHPPPTTNNDPPDVYERMDSAQSPPPQLHMPSGGSHGNLQHQAPPPATTAGGGGGNPRQPHNMKGGGGGGGFQSGSGRGGEEDVMKILRQKDSEIHLLRMTVTDKDIQLGKLTRDLDQCHVQMKHLNQLLTEKKEDILTHQDQIANMRAELAELRDMAHMGDKGGGGPRGSEVNTKAEHALQIQVQQYSEQVMALQRQLDEQRRHYEQRLERERERGGGGGGRVYQNMRGDQSELQIVSQQRDQARMELSDAQRQNLDLKTRVQMLEVQVSIYKEDFQSERSDRERAQAELLVVKEERDSLKQAVTVLQQQR